MTRGAPLSYGQELLWQLDHATPGLLAYNVPRAFRIRGALDADVLRQAMHALVERHEVLRSVYALVGDHPEQRVLEQFEVPFERVDLSALGEAAREATLTRELAGRAAYHFDLATDVMLRATLFQLAPDEHALFFLTHHIVSDGWTKSITFLELSELYAAFAAGRAADLRALPMQFADFARGERARAESGALEENLAYWREQLRGPLPVLELSPDRPLSATHSFAGASREIVLPAALVDRIRRLGQEHGASLYMVLLSAYQSLLHRYSGQDDIIVGSPTAGREDDDLQHLIGYFAGALVMRTSFAGDPTFSELLDRVSNTALDAYEHQDVPFEKLVLELQKGQELTHAPLFQCVLTMEDTIPATLTLGATEIEPIEIAADATKFNLVLLFSEYQGGLRLRLGYRTALFDPERMDRFLGHLQTMLESVVGDPTQKISTLPLLTASERAQLLDAWSGAGTPSPAVGTVLSLIDQHASAALAHDAVIGEDETVSWRELDARANRIACWLGERGVGTGAVVGICLDRTAAMVVAMLGVLRSGAAYVPLAPDLPAARIAHQMQESGAAVVITTSVNRDKVPSGEHVLLLDTDHAALDALSSEKAGIAVTPDDLAYVLFTSGSTGVPKGVAVTHGNLAHYVGAIAERFGKELAPSAEPWHFATVSTFAADLGLTAMYPALCSGGTLHVLPAAVTTESSRFAQYVAAHPIDVLKITPNHLRALLAGAGTPAPLPRKWVVLGGEAASWELVHELRAAGQCRVMNHYGPTETTVGACTFDVSSDRGNSNAVTVPLGRPLAGTSVYVRDVTGQLSPVGIPGELHIGGAGVARGYLGRDDLTQERFVTDPYSAAAGARLYRTGDRVRWLASGDLEFLGRFDHQVKVRGYRVELGEIEQVLRSHPGVANCAMLLRGADAGAQLVAYVVPSAAGYAVSHSDRATAERLTALVASQLPDYMVPGSFVFLEELPLTANGKLNRGALPAPDAVAEDSYVAPVTDTERAMATIWSDILKRERVGTTETFMSLGGHSLLAIRVLGKISKQFGVRLPLRTLFDAPTVAALSRVVDDMRREKEEASLRAALAAVEGLSEAEVMQALGTQDPGTGT